MSYVEEHGRMEDWARVVRAAGFVCDGNPAKVYELATLIIHDAEVDRLYRAAYDATTEQARMNKVLAAVMNDTLPPDEPFALVGVLAAMPLEQREALQVRVVALYQQKKVVVE